MKATKSTITYLFFSLVIILNCYGQDWKVSFDSSVYYLDVKNYDSAVIQLESVLDLSFQNSLKNPSDTSYGVSLQYLGFYYELLNEFKKAEKYYSKSIEWWEKSENSGHQEHINSVSYLGVLYLTLDRYEEAEKFALKTISMVEDKFGKNHLKYGISLNALAETYRLMGKTEEAISLYRQSMTISEQLGLSETFHYAIFLNNLAIAYQKTSNYGQAEINYLKSLKIIEDVYGSSHPEYITTLNNLSVLYKSMGRIDYSEKLIKQMLELTIEGFGKKHSNYALALNNSGSIYMALGRYDEALRNFKEALSIYNGIHGSIYNQRSASALQNMAFLMEKKGEYAVAEKLLIESIEITAKIFGEHDWKYAHSIKALGIFYHNIGQYEKSKKLLSKALGLIIDIYGDHSDKRFEFQIRLVQSQVHESPKEQYFQDYLDVIKFIVEKLSLNLQFLNESEKKEFWDSRSDMMHDFYNYAITISDSAHNYNVAGALYDLQLLTKSILLNSMTKLRKDIQNANDLELELLFEQWIQKRNMYTRAISMSKKEREKKLFNLDTLSLSINKLEKELSVKSSAFSQDTLNNSVSWRDIKDRLKPGEAAIEMLKYKVIRDGLEDSLCYAALIVTSQTIEKPDIVVFPNGTKMDKEYFKSYRKILSQFKTDKNSYNQFWKPIRAKLEGINKVYFSADGIYNLINLNTLYNPESKNYLLDEIDIHLVTSTKDLRFFSNSSLEIDQRMTAGLFGNPSYVLNSDKIARYKNSNKNSVKNRGEGSESRNAYLRNFDILEQTETEVKKIAKILKRNNLQVHTYLEKEALEENVKSLVKPTILHMATHGFSKSSHRPGNYGKENSLPMLSSGLVFAGVSDYYLSNERPDADDGILTAYECSMLDLEKTELVVLSACETGLGQLINGEGVYGLQRGLKISGAKSVMMSLWKVNDLISQELMTTFYKEWMKTGDKLNAFRVAQQDLKKKYPHPYHWGGFILVGENTVLINDDGNSRWPIFLVLGITLLAALLYGYKKLKP